MPRRTRLVSRHERELADAHLHPLERIFKDGDLEELEEYIAEQLEKEQQHKGENFENNRYDEEEVLSYVGSRGSTEFLEFLLELNADDDKRKLFNKWFPAMSLGTPRFSATILLAASEHNQHEFLSFAAQLVKKKKIYRGLLTFNARSKRGISPLDEAARCDNILCINALVKECGVDVNDCDPVDMMTAAHVSAEAGTLEAMSLLFKLGAEIRKRRTKAGDSCLNLAKQCGHRAMMSWLLHYGLDKQHGGSGGGDADDAASHIVAEPRVAGSWVSALMDKSTLYFFVLVAIFSAIFGVLIILREN